MFPVSIKKYYNFLSVSVAGKWQQHYPWVRSLCVSVSAVLLKTVFSFISLRFKFTCTSFTFEGTNTSILRCCLHDRVSLKIKNSGWNLERFVGVTDVTGRTFSSTQAC